MLSDAGAQPKIARSVAQRLAGFERVSDALLRKRLAAEGEKGLAFKIKQVLLGDERT